jgi:hypothetical protein
MQDWTNLPTHGRRLNRIIRILEKRLKHTKNDEKTIRYANSIALLTRETVNIAKLHLGIKEALEKVETFGK